MEPNTIFSFVQWNGNNSLGSLLIIYLHSYSSLVLKHRIIVLPMETDHLILNIRFKTKNNGVLGRYVLYRTWRILILLHTYYYIIFTHFCQHTKTD